ncbi:MAG: alanine--tRNA ligase [Candidatus Lokiarchaeota archaeon]|nr:alanine--tRNA ligase [Candidatus Lokiarchaeota archaeon]MBD3339917.1 alanine--tRNA ligase [Candidatus Lokiarchaeota archaeon]
MLTDKQRKQLRKCKTDKEVKKAFKLIASENPDDYFPTKELRSLGYMRRKCATCGTHFWTTHEKREHCGDPACTGGFKVVEENPAGVKLTYIEVWNKIVEILEPRGYKPIKRYPCVARWNPTSEFTIASISAFQPYVVSGEVEPPAKKLLIPQFCLRFNDIENVGITGSHCTGFVMIGQHSFVPPEEWNQGELFMDMHDFITEGVGLSKNEITIHEDSWAGGGSFGCSLEFFSRGVELFNQVYTMFEQTPEGPRELKLKVLDMGLGQERVAWFSQGTPNMYEAVFPYVLSKLRKITNINLDLELYNEFSKFSAYLNIDEVEDMDEAWQTVGKKLGLSVDLLKEKILPMTAIYSIAEHARTLLFAINDGKLPSNVGGGYNLRVIFRRAISFIDKFDWNVKIDEVCAWHAEELRDIFPEVSDHLDDIRKILEVEEQKFFSTKKKANNILKKILENGTISTETLIELYDSNGINPDMVKKAAGKYNVAVRIPDNFYRLVLERHEQSEQIHATDKEIEVDLSGIPETEPLYYYDYMKYSNKAKVLKILDSMVVLDKTVAYPTSGGQLHDVGYINDQKFEDVFKQGNYIIHVLKDKPKFEEGDKVEIRVDQEWRKQLAQHHTATHIVNAAARDVLGQHINQAGAKKTLEKSHLDITHYEQISRDKIERIEERANEIVEKEIDLNLDFMPRSDAEQRYGMNIYQGGAVPGKKIRIVEIPNVEVEACGGTHLNNTGEAGRIKITKSQKIQDGIVRLSFTAGEATDKLEERNQHILNKLQNLLGVEEKLLLGRIEELLRKWKNLNKALSSGNVNPKDLLLNSSKSYLDDDLLTKISRVLITPKKTVPSKVEKLYTEWKDAKDKIDRIENLLSDENIQNILKSATKYKDYKLILKSFNYLDQNDLKNLSVKLLDESDDLITVLVNQTDKGFLLMGMLGKNPAKESDLVIGNFIREIVNHFGGKGGGKKDFGQGFIPNKKLKATEITNYIEANLKK